MHFKQAEVGLYRVYAGAMEAPQGGYTAGVAVEQVRGLFGGPRSIFSEELLNGGHRFDDAAAALQQALAIGRKVAYAQPEYAPRAHAAHRVGIAATLPSHAVSQRANSDPVL